MAEQDDREAAIEHARQLITAGMIAELITDIRGMASAILTFAERLDDTDTRVAELHSLRRRNGIIAGAALGLVVVLAGVVIGGGILLTSIARSNQSNGRYLVECTTPTPTSTTSPVSPHTCYEDARAATSDAVSAIVRSTVDAAICARTFADEAAIRACVAEKARP